MGLTPWPGGNTDEWLPGFMPSNYYDVRLWGNYRATDNTDIINAALAAIYAEGGQHALYLPQNRVGSSNEPIIALGPLVVQNSALPANTITDARQPEIDIFGDGWAWAAGLNPSTNNVGGTLLDLRYDGSGSNPFANDYAVVPGGNNYEASGTLTATLTLPTGVGYFGDNTPTSAPSATTQQTASVGALADGLWYADITAASSLSLNQTATAATGAIRMWKVRVVSGIITELIDCRPWLGKFMSRAAGTVHIHHLCMGRFDARATQDLPFLAIGGRSTADPHDLQFYGSQAGSLLVEPVHDAIQLAGAGGQVTGFTSSDTQTAGSASGGYGHSIRKIRCANIRRGVWARSDCSSFPIDDVWLYSGCGASFGRSGIDLTAASGVKVRDCLVEGTFYTESYASREKGGSIFIGNDVLDTVFATLHANITAGDTTFSVNDNMGQGLTGNGQYWANRWITVQGALGVWERIKTTTVAPGAGPFTVTIDTAKFPGGFANSYTAPGAVSPNVSAFRQTTPTNLTGSIFLPGNLAAGSAMQIVYDDAMLAGATRRNWSTVLFGIGNATVQYGGSVLPQPVTLFPIQAPTATAPPYSKGGMYFDTTLNKMRIGGAAGWETVTSI